MADSTETRDSWGGGVTSGEDAAFGRTSEAGGNYTGAGVGSSKAKDAIAKAKKDNPVFGWETLGKGILGAILGGLPGGVTGVVGSVKDATEEQKAAMVEAVQGAYPSLSEEQAKDLIGHVESLTDRGISRGDIDKGSDKEDIIEYLQNNWDADTSGANQTSTSTVKSYLASPEEKQVRSLYQTLFDRDNPDKEGVDYWTKLLDSGVTVDDLKAQMQEAGKDYEKVGDEWKNIETGEMTPDSEPQKYGYNEAIPQLWTDYVNTFYDQAYNEYTKQAGQYKDATDKVETQNQATLTGQREAVDKFDNTQSSLLSQAREENKQYYDRLLNELDGNKVSMNIMGQDISWTPKRIRDTEEGIYDRGYKSSQGLLDTGTTQAKNLLEANTDYYDDAKDVNSDTYRNSMALATLGNQNLNYLEALKKLAEEETNMRSADRGLTLNRDKLNAAVEADEPSAVDYVKGIGTVASSVSNVVDFLKKF